MNARSGSLRRLAVFALCACALARGLGAEARAATPPASFPAAGEIVWEKIAVRAAPRGSAKIIKVLHQFRADFRLQIVHAVAARKDARGRYWYKLSLPMRPNGTFGWARADGLAVVPMKKKIVIDRSARILKLVKGRDVLLKTRVAVGAPGMETPLGYFYVTAKFRPTATILGVYAFETSAYSRLSDWPGGGIVGIHGTYQPSLLGQAVSHGCVRMSNTAVLRLKRLAPLGTPIRIIR